jgi:hypothetical protein
MQSSTLTIDPLGLTAAAEYARKMFVDAEGLTQPNCDSYTTWPQGPFGGTQQQAVKKTPQGLRPVY